MAIAFVPRRGLILLCHFDMARIPPEMRKTRRVVVVSPRSHNRRHGQGPGRCVVVPFSASTPPAPTPADVSFAAGVYASLTVPTWAICAAVMSVSHDRLNRVVAGGQGLDEVLSADDMERIEAGLVYALGMAAPRR
ncbi:type II toxin-antitoxin system PemK/MazF family toxin [Methylobacterium sp. SyP6R]|uniref:type II toxin-antitoxin system PemK/MazF family toxin n=1 Tax=Methylobacterium sp. SyP6R TaxID=2718876 RepID=UPI001F1E0B21|nr:type II toxin-antitoxin system PemK/MazF family toxin [Methylobacterium sp. SyP6R]MCF4130275.1 type II toxin-antitoxin system PemK/MazF family toxin [Methylobacterium sp. SyP6R]